VRKNDRERAQGGGVWVGGMDGWMDDYWMEGQVGQEGQVEQESQVGHVRWVGEGGQERAAPEICI